MNYKLIIISCLLPFFLSFIGALVISQFGYRLALVDYPNKRSSHTSPIPRGGGIGIWLAAIIVGIFILKNILFVFIIIGLGLLCLLEDSLGLSPKLRLLSHIIFSAILVFLFLGAPVSIINIAVFLFWAVFITGTANFYNFMDGINGIAGLTGLAAFGLMAYFSYFIAGNLNIALMSIALSVACLGFLPFNVPRAKVFMGDIGSILLGFVFGLMVMWLARNFLDFICLASFLFIFYADELSTMSRRIKNRENLTLSHRSHLYQLLVNELHIPHWKVSVSYTVAQALIGLSVFLIRPFGVLVLLLALLAYFILFILFSFDVRRRVKT